MTLSLTLVIVMAVLFACGIYLMLERSLTRVVLGFLLVGNAANLLIILMAGAQGIAPIVEDPAADADQYTDPLPQALLLTAIVITFAVSAFMLALIYRSWRLANADDLDDDADDLALRTGAQVVPVEETAPDEATTEFLPDPLDPTEAVPGTEVAERTERGETR
ncbi:multisubunit sodium/proton antiporter MrpC subunit [Microcella alkaliphila]|jgi:multisubunit Na+/H+ antiporter MnhC subunit|uniref:Multisubunit sodium/proton antiporter MrpC subunit n=1 Tax=Microcella alkaliphila TaxID=279828 RepID=A0A4Q7TFA9_9MICO|nr:Na(+)/H(+) antiporter subunit C [Microcella alkaliphila]RZT58108.1 multisubunit sodium/proton antiporter MrpC subunit [Microcella alkaliphila]